MSSSEIHENFDEEISYATVKRLLSNLLKEKLISTSGQGKATRYRISPSYLILRPIDMDSYYQKEIDDRIVQTTFNFDLISKILPKIELFKASELLHLDSLQKKFKKKTKVLSRLEFEKELERLAIDLSWKSSQIEGNTYTLLETERLLKQNETASGRTKEEAIMLLNHKEAIDLIVKHTDYLFPLSPSKIEEVHGILIKNLGIDKSIRRGRVGITGTRYTPLDNEYQINDALRDMCVLVNRKKNIFEKALLTLLLISYIQPFVDGNKRTARIVSNSMFIKHQHCPLSFRTVDSLEYKKAMLIFYEQNNISCFKEIFIQQVEFAVETYF